MHRITIQRMVPKDTMPASSLLKMWAREALKKKSEDSELNIRIVDISEMTALNVRYRHKQGPTNVLSFPFEMPPEEHFEELPSLGDIVVCAEIVNQEAIMQGKSTNAHWAHMIVHSALHLLGYDHETDADAAIMEPQEIYILSDLGFKNPYQLTEKGTLK
jgi:probable rRNA maturation factor